MMQASVPGLTDEELVGLQEWASSNPRVAALDVFGSRARGDHHTDSDVDVAIALTDDPDDEAAGLWVFRREIWNAELTDRLGLDVRLVRLTPDDDGGIGAGVAADSIRVFTKPDA